MESRSCSKLRLAVALLAAAGFATSAHALNFGNMMNPGSWFGSNNNRDDLPPPAYGYGAPGYGYGAPGGYASPYGYPPAAPPAYAAPVAPAAPAVSAVPPSPAPADDSEARIKALEKRIQELEAAQQPRPQPNYQSGYGGTPLPMQSMPRAPQGNATQQPAMPGGGSPTFRPMGQQ